MSETFYKVLTTNMTGGYSNTHWYPRRWMPPVEGALRMCLTGYHLCRRDDLIHWLHIGPYIYEAKCRGEKIDEDTKVCVREARLVRRLKTWNDRTQRRFAADCAEHVLPIFEKQYPTDDRPRRAIEAARKFARGEINNDERTAARVAARVAVRAAALDVAWAATGAAALDAAWAAAGTAAGDANTAAWAAAWDAAWAAARVAAGTAERAWQTERLFYYLDGEEEA